MFSRRFLLAAGAASAAMPFAGLAQAAADRSQISERQMQALLTRLGRPLRMLVPNGAQANLGPVTAHFEHECNCPVETIVTDVDNINSALILESITPASQIDIALPATFGIPDLVESRAILPVDQFAKAHQPSDFAGSQLYQSGDTFDGQHWGYQTDGDVYLMFYNRRMMENTDEQSRYADLTGTPLAIPRTWDEVDRQMAFFHRPETGQYGGCLFRTANYVAWEWWSRFHAAGGLPFHSDCRPGVASEVGLAALEAMIVSAQHLTGANLGLFDNWKRYNRGDVFANIGWGGTQKSLNAPGSGMYGNVINGPLPGGVIDGEHVPLAYFNWGWSYVIARHCPVPELAYLFCQTAVDTEVSARSIAEIDGYFDPYRVEHYEDPGIVKVYGKDFLNVHRQAMSNAIPDFYVARRGSYFEALNYWLLNALSGEVSPRAALKSIELAWELTTEQVGRAAQLQRWNALYSSYPASAKRVSRPHNAI